MLQQFVHYFLHFAFPGLIAYIFFRQQWKKAWLIMIATMLVDLDHLVSDPVFSFTRCSINFHPLHSYWAFILYGVFLIRKETRILGVGLLFHMLTDYIDCNWNYYDPIM